jgi:hypothetical protein
MKCLALFVLLVRFAAPALLAQLAALALLARMTLPALLRQLAALAQSALFPRLAVLAQRGLFARLAVLARLVPPAERRHWRPPVARLPPWHRLSSPPQDSTKRQDIVFFSLDLLQK